MMIDFEENGLAKKSFALIFIWKTFSYENTQSFLTKSVLNFQGEKEGKQRKSSPNSEKPYLYRVNIDQA